MKQMFSKEELQALSKEVADTEIDESLVANPELEGDEETLSSIGIKGTNYTVGGGGSEVHLYEHNLNIDLSSARLFLRLYRSYSTPIASSDFISILEEYNVYIQGGAYTGTGYYAPTLKKGTGDKVKIMKFNGNDEEYAISSITDTVYQVL